MSYSVFRLEQLMDNPGYKGICDKLIGLAPDEETRSKVETILYEGGYNGFSFSGDIGKNNPGIDIQRRVGMAYLALRNPETFDQLVENKIVYFHGTNANALPGILKYGINSIDKSAEEGIEVTTGETWSRIQGKRSFVSFTDVLDIAEGYSTFGSTKKNELDFPVVFGTTKEDITNSRFTPIRSDVPEVGVKGGFPKESITCVMVPSNKVDLVMKMADPELLVLPVDDIERKFYSIDDMHTIYTDDNKYKEFGRTISNAPELKGIKESLFSRTVSKIKDKVDKLKGIIRGDELDYGYGNSK